MANVNTSGTNNHDIASLHRKINGFINELIQSVSNSNSQISSWDQKRLATYLVALKRYVAWVVGQDELDLPKTSPKTIILGVNPEGTIVENEEITDMVRLMEIARDELVSSQSSTKSNGLIPFDEVRLLAIINKMESFLEGYIADVAPLDMPESSPTRSVASAGK